MSARLQSKISDFLHSRQYRDSARFALQAARALHDTDTSNRGEIIAVLSSIRTTFFRTNRVDKAEVVEDLATYLGDHGILSAPDAQEQCRVVFMAANPPATTRLALDEEVRSIREMLRKAKYRDRVELTSEWAVRPDDLLQILNEAPATVVHFSGHGGGRSGLAFAGDSGSATPVSADALRATFSSCRPAPRLVLFNACYSEEQARAIVGTVDCTIGMSDSVSDRAATVFAASLYRAVAFGKSLQVAFDQAVAALKLEGLPEEDTPALLTRSGVRAGDIVLVSPL